MKCCINDVNFIRLLLLSSYIQSYVSLKFKNMVKIYVYISSIFSCPVTIVEFFPPNCDLRTYYSQSYAGILGSGLILCLINDGLIRNSLI